MQAVLLEDPGGRFGPLTLLRPQFDLRCGMLTLREKLEVRRPEWRVALHPRPEIAEVVAESHPGRGLASLTDEQTLALYGRVVVNDALLEAVEGLRGDVTLLAGGEPVGAVLSSGAVERLESSGAASAGVGALGIPETAEVPAVSARYTWDLVARTGDEIVADAAVAAELGQIRAEPHGSATLVGSNAISVGEGCDMGPGVVLDARDGPVVVGRNVTVMANAVIVGPACVGDYCIVRAGTVIYGGTSVGPVCKVGGEISSSVFQSHANKQHGGYLGNSYVGSWVNLGAATNTSDLKNNYGSVRVRVDGESVDTGLSSVGAAIGDHTKTAIGTRLNTGTVVGIFCSVVTDGFPPKSIPSFSWVTPDGADRHDVDRAVDTARTVMARRGVELTPALERRVRDVYQTAAQP